MYNAAKRVEQISDMTWRQTRIEVNNNVKVFTRRKPLFDLVVDESTVLISDPPDVLTLPDKHGVGMRDNLSLPFERRVPARHGRVRLDQYWKKSGKKEKGAF
jgi:hypothetical protein